MTLLRAGNIDLESEEYVEADYEDTTWYKERGIPPPLRPTLGDRTEFVKDANGWIHLIKNGRETGYGSFQTPMISDVPPGLMVDDVFTKYEEQATEWKGSSLYAEMVDFVQHTIMQVEDLELDSCTCIGIGTFAGEHPYCPGGRSFGQLAAIESLVEILRK